MSQILPIRDLRDTTKISNLCHENNEHHYFTRLKMHGAIMAGKEQADKGKLVDGAEAMKKIRDKYGI